MTLHELPSGARACVQTIAGGREVAARLAALGLVPGTNIEMLQNRRRGPLLILVRETRIALGRGEAHRIGVAKVDE